MGARRDGHDRVRPAAAAFAARRQIPRDRARSAASRGHRASGLACSRRPRLMHKRFAVLASVLLLGSCAGMNDWLEGKGKTDYKSASSLPPLEVPPDLTAPARDNRYAVPDSAPSSATLSGYQAERREARPAAATATAAVLPQPEHMRIQRAGSQRWLAVDEPPERLWPPVRGFWQENGFLIKLEEPDIGVMETDWAEHREKVPEGGVRGLLSRAFGTVYSTSERDKFRTRLDR